MFKFVPVISCLVHSYRLVPFGSGILVLFIRKLDNFDWFLSGYHFFSKPVHFVRHLNGWISNAWLQGKMDHLNNGLIPYSVSPLLGFHTDQVFPTQFLNCLLKPCLRPLEVDINVE